MKTLLAHLGGITRDDMWKMRTKNLCYYILHSDGVTFEVKDTVGLEKYNPQGK